MKKILATLILVGLSLTANAQKTLVVNNSGVIQGPVSLATFAAANGLLFANGPLAFGGFASITGTIPPANGGTGVDNTGKTITLGGNLVTSGAYSLTLTATANTNVTFPASGTLLTTTGSAANLTNFPTFNQNTTGNAGTATLLQTPRNIAGVSFNGGANISLASTNLSDSSSLLRSSDLNSTVQSYNARTRIGGNVSLAGGTTLAIGNEYFDTLSAARTLTFSGTPLAGGNPTVLHLTGSGGPWTLTFPASIRDGSGDTTPITSLSIPNGPQDLTWYYSDATPHLHLIDSIADASGDTGGGLTAVEDDPSPALGGDLDLNGYSIIGANTFNYGDDSDYTDNFIPFRDISGHTWSYIYRANLLDGLSLPATSVSYNPASSGLPATSSQAAIDTLATRTAQSNVTTTIPTSLNDNTQGYSARSVWINTAGEIYMCQSAATGAAVWRQISNAASGTPTPTPSPTATPTPTATPGTYLVNQTFEGTGFANGETWVWGAAADPDYTGYVIDGAQSLHTNPGGVSTSYAYTSFTAQDTVYCQVRFRLTSLGANSTVATIRTSSAARLTLGVNTSNQLTVTASGGTTNIATGAMPTNTDLWIWMDYSTGTGSNATAKAGWSTTSTKPTLTAGGTQTCVSSNGTGTDQVSRIQLGASGTSTFDITWDDVILNSTVVP